MYANNLMHVTSDSESEEDGKDESKYDEATHEKMKRMNIEWHFNRYAGCVKDAKAYNSQIWAKARKVYLAYALIAKSDQDCYSKLKEELQNDYAKGHNNYPNMVMEAYNLLCNFLYRSQQSS